MKSIIINNGETKTVFFSNEINDNQIFQLAGFIQKNLHQLNNSLTNEDLIELVKTELGISFACSKLVAEININKL